MTKTSTDAIAELTKFNVYTFHTYSEYEGHLSEVINVTLYESEFDIIYMITFPYDFELYNKVKNVNHYYAIDPFNKEKTVNDFVKKLKEGTLL